MQKVIISFLACLILLLPLSNQGASGADANIADRMWFHLKTLSDFGPRPPGTIAHQNTQRYIESIGRTYADQVKVHPFSHAIPDGMPLRMHNIEMIFEGTEGGRPILLGAHFDTRPFSDEDPEPANQVLPVPGVNDGGSGTAVLLGLAEYLSKHRIRRPVHLVFFDGEDFGERGSKNYFLGSKDYANGLKSRPESEWPFCVLVVDMVGDADLNIKKEIYSKESASWLLDTVFEVADEKGFDQFIPENGYTIRDDHLPFAKMRIPSVVLIDFDYKPWHTQEDTLDKCSKESLRVVFETVVGTLSRL